MKKLKVVYLDISSYQGISIGASHWYGKLICDGRHVELHRVLTARTASDMNHKWNCGNTFKRGSLCKSFDSEQEIIDLAKKTWKKHFSDARVLILGRNTVADPQKVLIGPRDFKSKVNAWYKRSERIGGYDGGHRQEMHQISDDFWSYFRDRTGD